MACLLGSCGWRVFENGHYKTDSLPPSTRDFILTVSLSNTIPIPATAIVIGHTMIEAPFEASAYDYEDYDFFVTAARNEAARLGGNMMKINQFHGVIGTKWSRQAIYTTVYRMKQPDLERFAWQMDSAKRHYADSIGSMAIVHIRDGDWMRHRVVYFNDSMVARLHGVGFENTRRPGRSDLVFRQKGALRVVPGSPSLLDIELGKEYFILLHIGGRRSRTRYYCELMDKEHFYYKLK